MREPEWYVAEDEFRAAMSGIFKSPQVKFREQWFEQSSLYQEVLESVSGLGSEAMRSSNKPGSKPPMWTAGFDWIGDIDRQLVRWSPALVGASPLLRADHLMLFPPATTIPELQYATEKVHDWWRTGFDLVHQNASLNVHAKCPACGVSEIFQKDALGETVRHVAIKVSVYGASCLACSQSWMPEELVDLALQVETLPEACG